MNKLMLAKKRRDTWYKYHAPGGTPLTGRVKRNAVFISTANSIEHEMLKVKVCYLLRKDGKQFLTEAIENSTNLRRDVICLDDNMAFEIELNSRRAERHKGQENVVVIRSMEDLENGL